MRAGIQDL